MASSLITAEAGQRSRYLRLSFEKPTQPEAYVGGFLPPSFRAEDGLLLFDWLIGEVEGDYYRVKRTMKCRVREPGTR
jgi:hypothetical protein